MIDTTTWFSDLPEADQEHIREEAIEYFAELIETGSVTMTLPSGTFVLSLSIQKERT